jgi:GT2 family glycosyltransferase
MEEDAEWLLMVDDDHVFAPDLLERLLSHEVDIVAALALRRDEPYGPFCFVGTAGPGVYVPADLREHAPDDLLQVRAVGTGAMLIRRRVFETLPAPWFTISEESGEDMRFCDAAHAAGLPIHCDLGARLGHLTTTAVWPVSNPEWKVGFVISDETRILRDLPPSGHLQA